MTDAPKPPDEWMPLLVDKYLGDTTHLTTEQHGAYLLMLMTGWKRAGVLPVQDAQLAAITRLSPPRWRASRDVLLSFFHRTPDGYVQKRLTIEVERARHLSSVRTEAGKKGSRSRWQSDSKPDGKRIANAIANPMANDMANEVANEVANPVANAWQKGGQGDSPNPISSASAHPLTQTLVLSSESTARALAGEACKAMKAAGMAAVSPSNPKLIAMLDQGMTLEELSDAARTAVEQGKGFSWALERAAGRRADAAKVKLAPQSKRSALMSAILERGRVAEAAMREHEKQGGSDDLDDDVRARG